MTLFVTLRRSQTKKKKSMTKILKKLINQHDCGHHIPDAPVYKDVSSV